MRLDKSYYNTNRVEDEAAGLDADLKPTRSGRFAPSVGRRVFKKYSGEHYKASQIGPRLESRGEHTYEHCLSKGQ